MSASARIRSTDLLDDFSLLSDLDATKPPEMRGLQRDDVALMVASPERFEHRRFSDLASVLRPGDLLVVNNSATLPAAVETSHDRVIHFSTELPGGLRMVEIRRIDGFGSAPLLDLVPGSLPLPDGGVLELLAPFSRATTSKRLWVAHLAGSNFEKLLADHGRPISYQHTADRFQLDSYQTVFAIKPGSAEMPSAGRPFSERLVTRLVSAGVAIAPVTLHTGVSSLEANETPPAERYWVPEPTATAINRTRSSSGRVVAVGTSVVRALETAADPAGRVNTTHGWTDLVITGDHEIVSIDGLITGWHEPRSTHIEMLTAVAGRDLLVESYRQALQLGYRWHEFGDSHLIWREGR